MSLQEGARICPWLTWRGVRLFVADETTLMAGGSYKALEAAVTMALARRRQERQVAFSSGANAGVCLTLYGRKAGVETFFFHPKATGWKLDAETFAAETSHLISVDKPEKEVKRAARLFAERRGIPHVPAEEVRYQASGPRALMLFEYARQHGLRFDWVAQAVCAGFGPIAFYNSVRRLLAEGVVTRDEVPRFLGLQQEDLAPMATAWRAGHARIEPGDVARDGTDLLVPNLYNTSPDASYPELFARLREFGGDLRQVSRADYAERTPMVIAELERIGIPLTRLDDGRGSTIAEKAGLLALSGALKAIDDGLITAGQTMLVFLTGGSARTSGRRAVPEFSIGRDEVLEEALERYLARP